MVPGFIPNDGGRVILHILPEGRLEVISRSYRGLVLTEIFRKGRYDVLRREDNTIWLRVRFRHSRETLISFCGIEMDEVRPVLSSDIYDQPYEIQAEIVQNDLFVIGEETRSNGKMYYHLVRSDSTFIPQAQIPLSNLVFTNILTMLLTYVLHMMIHVNL